MDEISEDTYFIDEENENLTEISSYHEITDYENVGFCSTVKTDLGHENMDSWDVYMRYVRFYDLVQRSSIQKQFNSNIIDVELYRLCSNEIKALSEALKQNKHVTTLNLTGNDLTTTGCSYLSDLLLNNHVIKHLNLSRCDIDCQGANELSKVLEMSVLKSLNLSYNKIKRAGLRSVLESLQTNAHLQELDLSYNDLRCDCVEDIRMVIEMNNMIEKLNLSGNFFNRKSELSLLFTTLVRLNETLQVLILQWNGISGACAELFKNLIIKSEGLKILDLSWNNMRDIGTMLGEGIRKTTILEDLDLSHNPMTTDDVVELLNCVSETSSLRFLRMTHIRVDEQLEKAISSARSRNLNFTVKVHSYTGIKTEPVDLQALFLQRIHFLGVTKPKKKSKKVDIGHTLLIMKNEGRLEPMKKSMFLETFNNLNIIKGEEVIEEIAKAFTNKNKKIDVALMLDKYLEIYPNTT